MKTTETKKQETLRDQFFAPLEIALGRAKYTRACNNYSDQTFVHSGVGRVIEASKSGRAWIQFFCTVACVSISVANFFAALRSKRRLRLLEEVDANVRQQVDQQSCEHSDPFASYPELETFEIYASDGHSHGASAHEEAIDGKKRAVNHIFSLNLRTHTLAHLTVTQPAEGQKKEHEIKAIKRLGGNALRLDAPKGTKVIHAYDPAIIDYREWYKWKQGNGVYIITREKSNSQLLVLEVRVWDKEDPRNAGVISDKLMLSASGVSIRRVRYCDPVTGQAYSFLTTEMTLPPGLIAFIYKLRWDVEKVFDEVENKLEQKKAWGKQDTTKTQQALFICLAHNLLMRLEKKLEVEEGITDEKVLRKQAKRLALDIQKAHDAGRTPNCLVENVSRATQRSLQFIRWLRTGLTLNTSWEKAVERVRPLMLNYLS